ncbi:MAG TPA: hypothetical protein VIS78_06425, partial [Blastocatellia bacterium]
MQDTIKVTREVIEREKSHDHGYRMNARPFNRLGGLRRRLLPALLFCLLATASVAVAQEPPKANVAS